MDDVVIAKKYLNKARNAATAGHEFDLTFNTFKRLMTKKRCMLSGVQLTNHTGTLPIGTDRTLDRLDSNLGYTEDNTIVVCHEVNALKAKLENPISMLSAKVVQKVLKTLARLKVDL